VNAKKQSIFADRVTMYVYEEIIDGKKLTEIINETHENVKYLPGHKIPENVVRCSPQGFAYLSGGLSAADFSTTFTPLALMLRVP